MKQDEGVVMLTRAIKAARATDPEAAAFLADGLHLVRSGSAKSLDLALGLAGRGIASIATRERLSRRDRHIKAAFDLIAFDETTSNPARIRELASEVSLFAASTWRWAHHHAEPPSRLTALQCELWHAMHCGTVPTSATHLKRIIAEHETPGFDG